MLEVPLSLGDDTRQGFLEEAQWHAEGDQPLRLSGWLFCGTDRPWRSLQARVGGLVLRSLGPSHRPDVFAACGNAPGSEQSGFSFPLPVLDPDTEVELVVVFDDGTTDSLISIPVYRIPGRSGLLPSQQRPPADPPVPKNPSESSLSSVGFSLVIPVHRPDLDELKECLEAVAAQTWPNWQLVIIEDGLGSPEQQHLLQQCAVADPRITLIGNEENRGIAAATNLGVAQAKFPWICFIDQDDLLRPDALAWLAHATSLHGDALVFYTDEEKITQAGDFHSALLKPAWSPHLLRGVMYLGHLLCVRTSLVRTVGGLNPIFDGVQDYEFALRLAEQGAPIRHLPAILYQWRMGERSSAREGNIKGNMDELQTRAVAEHLIRLNHPGKVISRGRHRVLVDPPDDFITPAFTEINWSISPETGNASPSADALVVVRDRHVARGELGGDDLRRLLFHASIETKQVFVPVYHSSDGVVVESGCTLAPDGRLVRVMRGFDPASDGWHGSLACHREAAATSGAVVVMSASHWHSLCQDGWAAGGSLGEALARLGQAVVVLANSVLKLISEFAETQAVGGKLTEAMLGDPWWNPKFDPVFGDYRLAESTANAEEFRYDFPLPKSTSDPHIQIIGWCLTPQRHAVAATRLRGEDWELETAVGLPRPDVSLLVPEARGCDPGFEFRLELPAGVHRIFWEIKRTPEAPWQVLEERRLKIRRDQEDGYIDDPGKLVAFQFGLHPRFPLGSTESAVKPIPSTRRDLPRLTLVTPSFNQAQYLPRTVQSVQANLQEGLEYLIQDGDSDDATLAFLDTLDPAHVSWCSEKDSGQADAIVRAFARATPIGPDDLMAWINSDDEFAPGALDQVREFFADHPEVDVLYANRIVIDEQQRVLNRWFLPRHDPEVLKLNDYIPQETLFWRKRIWYAVGGLDPTWQFALDWDLLLRFHEAGARFHHLPEFLGLFRVHSAQKTSAQMAHIGQQEIDRLRRRTFGRDLTPEEITYHPTITAFLRDSYRLARKAEIGTFPEDAG